MKRKDLIKISQFLDKSKEGSGIAYNRKLHKLVTSLQIVPPSYFRYVQQTVKPTVWKRGDPIEKTPATHMIHASYYRVFKPSCFNRRDIYIGRPRPDIFLKEHSIMSDLAPNTIRPATYLYTMVKPFGSEFHDEVFTHGMLFKLHEIWDPLYVCERVDGPMPIFRNGIKIMPMRNEIYTVLYKDYIKQRPK